MYIGINIPKGCRMSIKKQNCLKMGRKVALLATVCALFVACSDEEDDFFVQRADDEESDESSSSKKSSTKSSSSEENDILVVTSFDDLFVCTDKREGMFAYVKDERKTYVCEDGDWVIDDGAPVSSSEDEETSSSSKGKSSASEDKSSSSSVIELASSSSLSFYVFEPGQDDLMSPYMWKGFEGEYYVNTGRDNGTETSGYWFVVDDHEDGGLSTIIWPAKLGNEYSEEALDPVIDYCRGICGIFNLRAGSLDYRPFVGVAFNVAGTATATGGPATTTDVTRWCGICVRYASDAAIALELSMGEEKDAALGYDLPLAILPKESSFSYQCYAWSAFKQAGGGENTITGEDAARSLATVRFKIQAEDGTVGGFNIAALHGY